MSEHDQTMTTPSRRGRPPTFSRDELLATARRLGPDGIGLQNVANELGVARTSLYWHVRDQNELGELVLAEIVHEATAGGWTPDDDASWTVWLQNYTRTLRHTLLTGAGWLRYGTGRLFYTERAFHNADRLLGALLADGFSIEEATRAYTFCSQLVFASVRSATESDQRAAGRDEFLVELSSLPADEVPVLRAGLKAMSHTDLDMQFEYNLACALAGIAACAGRPVG
jgi:TetR/AcrR family tetracycline transcriptional repressor